MRDVRFLGWEDGHIDRFIVGHPCSVATGPDEILAIWYAGGATRTAIHSARLHID